jgi:hypothetical protein
MVLFTRHIGKLMASLTKRDLVSIKRFLLSGRVAVQDAAAISQRAGNEDFAERLRDVNERLANELDYVDRQIGGGGR